MAYAVCITPSPQNLPDAVNKRSNAFFVKKIQFL